MRKMVSALMVVVALVAMSCGSGAEDAAKKAADSLRVADSLAAVAAAEAAAAAAVDTTVVDSTAAAATTTETH